MNEEFEKAKKLTEDMQYEAAVKILLDLEAKETEDKLLRLEILKSISENYKNLEDFKSAFEYYKKYEEEEYQQLLSENKEKTDTLSSTLKIHQAQKENNLLEEKNKELQDANIELNNLREKKNDMLEIVSEELKLPIITIEGISLNFIRAAKDEEIKNSEEMKDELGIIETLAKEILDKVNSILQKNKEENQQ